MAVIDWSANVTTLGEIRCPPPEQDGDEEGRLTAVAAPPRHPLTRARSVRGAAQERPGGTTVAAAAAPQ
jgi:hypothetical protein